MGNCYSDVEGGKQAVGGVQQSPTATNNNAGHNDAVEFFYRSWGLPQHFTRVELSLSAINLRDRDIISKSDPMAVVYAKNIDGKLEELGRTEVILNSLNPTWIEKVIVAFQFEIVQPLVFHVYDVDTKFHNIPVKTLKLKDQDFLGEATCVLSEDPFLRISRIVESGGSIPICKTEVVNNNLNPKWKPLCLSMQQFGSKDNPLIIECFDFNSSGKHSLIGKLQKSVADLEKLQEGRSGENLTITSHHGHKKVLKGELFVDQFCEKEQYSFLDYVSCGFELNFMVAVDFTASNGNPQNPDSLHYIDPSGQLNSYQKAIMEVGEVIQFYDSDRRFPAWGFGGKTFDGTISHCFNLNGSAGSFEVEGVEGIMSAYASALHNVTLAGPTLFGQVIKRAAQIASQSISYNNKKYFVLLIITDGVLTDLQETKDALVKASDLPLSILIVGVGGADFGQMEVLDADKGQRLESSTDRVATRDIVQFVPMRDVHGGQISVVQALLEELPGQFLTYMRCRDIKPRPLHEAQVSST
ncbi:protein BONZAI 3-like isoform X2 [Carya illinoinensis]|uniref:protein BONZAI 3-like isoform X2 n=1 Tax=Carya illinoinensis TaxID=32201 RepID=UPI001C7296B8|nr:protein BONZAI 3-like isoform X2 [Carya illinoinensis]